MIVEKSSSCAEDRERCLEDVFLKQTLNLPQRSTKPVAEMRENHFSQRIRLALIQPYRSSLEVLLQSTSNCKVFIFHPLSLDLRAGF